MAYIAGFVLLITLFIVLHFFTEISSKQKVAVVGIVAAFILGAYLFNKNTEDRRVRMQNILIEFRHGNDIVCEGMKVNDKDFSYSSGTQTFLGKRDSKTYGRIISLDRCQ